MNDVRQDQLEHIAAGTTGPRGPIFDNPAQRPGFGTSRSWARVVRGTLYRFVIVNMPNGQVRWFVSRFNGYVGGPEFGCAWDRVRAWWFAA